MVNGSTYQDAHNHYMNLVNSNPFLHRISGESDYQQALDFVEQLMLDIGDNPDDVRWNLLEMASSAVTEYEDSQYPELLEEHNKSGVHMIKILMDKHDLTQSDLPDIGSQGVVSEILSGKRDLNTRQIKGLSERFNVDPAIFL